MISTTPSRWFFRGLLAGVLLSGALNAASYFARSGGWGGLLGGAAPGGEAIGFPLEVWRRGNVYAGFYVDYAAMGINVLCGLGLGIVCGLAALSQTRRLTRLVEEIETGVKREPARQYQFSLRGLLLATLLAAMFAAMGRAFGARPEMLAAVYLLGPSALVILAMLPRGISWQQRVIIITPAALAVIAVAVMAGVALKMDFEQVLIGVFVCWTPQSVLGAAAVSVAALVTHRRRQLLCLALIAIPLFVSSPALCQPPGDDKKPPQKKPPEAAEIETLIRQLGHPKFKLREAASKRLKAIGKPALADLKTAAANSDDLEIRQRAKALIRRIERPYVQLRMLRPGGYVWSVAVSPDGKLCASGSSNRTVHIWDAASGRAMRTMNGHTDHVEGVSFSPDGKWLASSSRDKTIALWETATGRFVRRLSGHASTIRGVTFSPDARRLVSASNDRTVRVWDVATGKLLLSLAGHTGDVKSAVFSPDGRRILTASLDKTARVWDVNTGKELCRFAGHDNYVWFGTFSPDGKSAASAGQDNNVRLWEVESGRQLRVFTGHTKQVISVRFTPDGKRLLSGGVDRTLRLWDAASGKELQRLTGHTHTIEAVAVSPDGHSFFTAGGGDGTVRAWGRE